MTSKQDRTFTAQYAVIMWNKPQYNKYIIPWYNRVSKPDIMLSVKSALNIIYNNIELQSLRSRCCLRWIRHIFQNFGPRFKYLNQFFSFLYPYSFFLFVSPDSNLAGDIITTTRLYTVWAIFIKYNIFSSKHHHLSS